MKPDTFEDTAADYLEIASEQRLNIIFNLLEKKSRVSVMAKKLGVTAQEVHRNFDRLSRAGIITKENDGYYHITPLGKAISVQVPSMVFLSKNRKFFENHDFGNLPFKFIQRIGAFENTEYLEGVSRVLEKWKSIYKNSNKYIFTLLSEIPLDLIEPLMKRVKNGVRHNHIIAEDAHVPKGRKKLLEKLGFYRMLEEGQIERRMQKQVTVSTILNEKEAIVMLPTKNGEPDMRSIFYGNDKRFHEWALDYFRYNWNIADSFKEFKLKE